ncbi:CinA family protein [uncultured Ferrovibrio sp.]|jgi:nicotinamide-nucleotide amidase|uniref:CinA family protein n=1 Tax=uncultured Ferrovibrio sp. TaxID=1576913 RepID=UPI002632F55C|nr:CinA family protein [uncultured Ferrovibrio sp.]
MDDTLLRLAEDLLARCRAKKLMLATAESCTGGLIAATLTEIAGSSDVFERGFVTYSNAAKSAQLGVPAEIIAGHGAVSEEVARAMAEGALRKSQADIAIACTGIAGPGGGTKTKPVGLVHIAVAGRDMATMHQRMTYGSIGRSAVRSATVEDALSLAREMVEEIGVAR